LSWCITTVKPFLSRYSFTFIGGSLAAAWPKALAVIKTAMVNNRNEKHVRRICKTPF
jgi:hypothetical protein